MVEHFGFPLETVILFTVVVAGSVWLDLFAHRHHQAITLRNAAGWSLFWVGTALSFYVYLWLRFSPHWADLFLAGYALEKSLSVDNLMLFMAIFSSFSIRGGLQHRILYWGIVGALLFRAIFVVVGTSLLAASPYVGFLFAALIAWSAVKMLQHEASGDEADDETDFSDHWSVRFVRRLFPVFPRLSGASFFVTRREVEQQGLTLPGARAWAATPAFLCLVAVEFSDVMFAFDSVPAVIAVTAEPLLVYAAMIFAVLGLRSLYFILAALADHLCHLEKAVIGLLFFIAVKLAAEASDKVFGWAPFHISPRLSLLVVLGCLLGGVVASWLWPRAAAAKNDP